MKAITNTIRTITSQAELLGYTVEVDFAATGTAYLTLSHEQRWPEGEDRVIRVGDHEANAARYVARINREPDLDVEPGFQAPAVERIARWIGVEPSDIPYLKRAATIAAYRRLAQEERAATLCAEGEAVKAACEARYAAATPGDRAKADRYEALRGKSRKNYRKRHAHALRRAGAMV